MRKLVLLVVISISLLFTFCKKEESDEVAPIITLEGTSPQYVARDSTYVEPGYKAIDDIDGDIVSYRWYNDGYRLLSTASEFRTVFNEGIHNITLYVFDNGGLSAAENITIKVSKEFIKIKGKRTVLVNSIRIDNSVDISADNILHTVATVYNNMGEDMHNLKFSVMIPGLGIYHTSAINLNKGKSAVITNNFELPKDIAPGEYDVRFTISNDLVKRTKHSTIIIK